MEVNMEILPNNNIKVKVTEEEYENSNNKDQFIVETYGENIKDYFKVVSDTNERNTILNIWIYKRLTAIAKIAKFFVILTIINIIVSIILALR